jgi:H-type lectin domain
MIQTGRVQLASQMPGWQLNTGSGFRTFISPDIKFTPSFNTTPQVAVALSGIITQAGILQAAVATSDVEADEFNILIQVWGDTSLTEVAVTWIAYD